MKNYKLTVITCLMLSFFYSSFVRTFAAYEKTPIRVGYFLADGFFDSHNGVLSGSGYDTFEFIAKQNQYEIEYIDCTLKECFNLLSNQEIDLLGGITLSESRKNLYQFSSVAMGSQSGSVFVRDKTIPYGNIKQLQDLKIGMMFENYYSTRFIDIALDESISFLPIFKHTYEELYALYQDETLDGFIAHSEANLPNTNRIYEFDLNYIYIISYLGNTALIEHVSKALLALPNRDIYPLAPAGQPLLTTDFTFLYILSILIFIGCALFAFYVTQQIKLHEAQQILRDRTKEIHHALTHHQIFFVYQPIVDYQNSQIAHLEALIRWNHPVKGMLAPNVFLEDIQTCGLMFEVFVQTMDQALSDYQNSFAAYFQEQTTSFHICINITYAILMDQRFIPAVQAAIKAYQVDGCLLCFEITEQMQHQELQQFNDRLVQLRSLDCKIAMDDFGMEYSSLLSLKQSDYDIYKIDKFFIDEILRDHTCQSITDAIISIGRILDKHVIAEGVESQEQVQQLYQMGCYLFQGYYFSKPLEKQQLILQLDAILAKTKEGAAA